jgi:hypothetical protein
LGKKGSAREVDPGSLDPDNGTLVASIGRAG